MNNPFVNYSFIPEGEDSRPILKDKLYAYVVARNGVFVAAIRTGLYAQIQVMGLDGDQPVRGLGKLTAMVNFPLIVPRKMLHEVFVSAWQDMPLEKLFYLHLNEQFNWSLDYPMQIQRKGSVRPANPFDRMSQEAIIELHSHNSMAPFFSSADNKDESNGFRIYTVIGLLNQDRPGILTRVGIYGHFWEIPSNWIYDLPDYVFDLWGVDHDSEE